MRSKHIVEINGYELKSTKYTLSLSKRFPRLDVFYHDWAINELIKAEHLRNSRLYDVFNPQIGD